MVLTIYHTAFHPAYFTRSCEKGPGNGRFSQMVKGISEFHSERKKRTTSGGCPQFPKRFSGKLPFHLTSNRNFRIFWLNGKHPSKYLKRTSKENKGLTKKSAFSFFKINFSLFFSGEYTAQPTDYSLTKTRNLSETPKFTFTETLIHIFLYFILSFRG